jgi:HD-GYP domain-containing protein (c-di-GMP phosphodiesterase class II)
MLKKIAVTDLRQGMYLHKLCGSWSQHPFWRSQFTLNDPAQIRTLLDSGILEVWIDAGKGLDLGDEPDAAPADQAPEAADAAVLARPAAAQAAKVRSVAPPKVAAPPAVQTVSLAEEMGRARKICDFAEQAVTAMFNEARMGRAISSAVAVALVVDITDSVNRNPDALISLARLKTADDYTYLHSVAVCALMIALSGKLGLDEAQTRHAGLAGLMHDLGKAAMPMDVLNKPGKLTDAEFAIIKRHPEEGHRMLQAGGVDVITLDVCLHHHEKMDGSGYPHGLKGEQISLYARMGAVCDVYDAITSNRAYKAGWEPAESVRRMTEWCEGHFDKRVFQAFVKSIGIYPTGSLVRLTSGRLAVVIGQGRTSLLKPVVRAFFSTKSKLPITPEMIDLARPGVAEKIAGVEDPDVWGITNLERYWME